jgi:hypothetical protein
MNKSVLDKVVVLIALGPNSVEIPCRFFENMKTGLAKTKNILGIEPTTKSTDEGVEYHFDIDLEAAPQEISATLFTGWYYGCGGVYGLVLKEVPFDTKFLSFDLD